MPPVADRNLGNSVGAIESAAHATKALSFGRVAALGASALPAWYKLAPFGGSALEFWLFGLR